MRRYCEVLMVGLKQFSFIKVEHAGQFTSCNCISRFFVTIKISESELGMMQGIVIL